MNAQTIVAANVAARGYMAGWSREEFIARQLCKMTEELDEAAEAFNVEDYYGWRRELNQAAGSARDFFDDKGHVWDDVELIDPDALRSELADMQVVLFAAAAALEVDVVQAAIDKSSADVARGVRDKA